MKKVLKFLCLVLIAVLIAILVLKNGARAASASASFSDSSVEKDGNVTLSVTFDQPITSCSGTFSCSGGALTTSSGDQLLMYQNPEGTSTVTFSLVATEAGQTEVSIDFGTVTYADQTEDSGVTASASINITDGEEPPPVENPYINISIGGSKSIEMSARDTSQVNIDSISPKGDSVTYSSTDTNVVYVDPQSGAVLAYSEGEADIVALTGSQASDRVHVRVNGGDRPPVDTFTASPASISTKVGTNTTVSVTGGTIDYNRLSSSAESVAIVARESETSFVVQAVGAGDATITVGKQDSETTASISVHVDNEVQPDPPAPEGETPVLNPTSVTLNAGGESATISSSIPVNWSSSDTSKVAIASGSSDTQATIISNNSGSAVITATAKEGGKTATVQVTVNKNEQAAPTITPSGNIKLEVGKSVFLSANQGVNWSSNNSSVASVSSDGTVTAKGVGEARITAKNGSGKSSSVTITVVQASNGGGSGDGSNTDEPANPDQGSETTSTFAISPTKTQTLNIGDTLQIKVTKGNASSWKSSKPAVATVDNSGKVTANSAGTTIITAVASDGSVAQVKVRVRGENGDVPDPDSESNTDVPSTGEASTELLLVLGVITCVVAMFIFRKKTK